MAALYHTASGAPAAAALTLATETTLPLITAAAQRRSRDARDGHA